MYKLSKDLKVEEAHKVLDKIYIGIFEEYVECSNSLEVKIEPTTVIIKKREKE